MSRKKLFTLFINHYFVWSVPLGVILASAFPLQTVIRQGLIGVLLIWFTITVMLSGQ